MRILQLSNYYAPELGGIEKIAQAISTSVLNKNDMRVVCFTHKRIGRNDEIDGVRVRRIGSQLTIASQQLSLQAYRIIKNEIASFKPDVIILHVPNPFLSEILLRMIPKETRLIVYWHSDIVKQKIGEKIFNGLTLRLLNRSQIIIATSPNYIDGSKYLSMYREKCRVVPNCIDEKELAIDEQTLRIVEQIKQKHMNKTLCVCVGRQVPYKGFEYIVEAFKRLDKTYYLILIGREGESSQNLRNLAKGMKNVEMMGEVDFCTLKAYLYACDIFCFPSITKNEAFGIALAEGMYFGKPAITFTIPGSGVNYVSLNGVTGIEVENRNVEGLSDAITLLGENIEIRKRLGDGAKKRVQECFLSNQYCKNIHDILNEIQKEQKQ